MREDISAEGIMAGTWDGYRSSWVGIGVPGAGISASRLGFGTRPRPSFHILQMFFSTSRTMGGRGVSLVFLLLQR